MTWLKLIERILSTLFPVKNYKIQTPEEAKAWFQYEASNHSELDPFRPMGLRDSWAGRVKEYEIFEPKNPKKARQRYVQANSYRRGDSILNYLNRS